MVSLKPDPGDGVFVVAVPLDSCLAAHEGDFVTQLGDVRRADVGEASIGVTADNGTQVR